MSEDAGSSAFKDLVIDATDGRRMAEFWAAAIGLTAEPTNPEGDAVLRGARPEQTVWINQVPEPRTVKQRVHLDLHAGAVDELIKLGATVDTEHAGWTVLRDPEGGEFCAFIRDHDQLTDYRLYELVVDAADPGRSAAGGLGGSVLIPDMTTTGRGGGWRAVHCLGRWSSIRCRKPRRSRTGSIGTSGDPRPTIWTPAQRWYGAGTTRSTGMFWQTPKVTSSACSRGSVGS